MNIKNILKKWFFVACLISVSGVVQCQSLPTLIQEAIQNNADIQGLAVRVAIDSEKINEVDAIPNTLVGAGFFASEPETRTGAQQFKVSISQMLPSFGTIKASKNYKSSLANQSFVALVIAKRKLKVAVSTAYYQLFTLRDKQAILQQQIDLLTTFEQMIVQAVEVNKASVVDVFRLQMRQKKLANLVQNFESSSAALEIKINKLLNRSTSILINTPTILNLPINVDTLKFEHDLVHPEILFFDKIYESVVNSEILNQKEQKPMIGFGLDYIQVAKRPNMNFTDNGKDIFMPMVRLSIPLFTKKYRSKSKQLQLAKEEISLQKLHRQNQLEVYLETAILKRKLAIHTYNTHLENFNQAKNIEQVLISRYETSNLNIKELIEIKQLQLQYQLDKADALQSFFEESLKINYLIQPTI